jgi:hypothetical protein
LIFSDTTTERVPFFVDAFADIVDESNSKGEDNVRRLLLSPTLIRIDDSEVYKYFSDVA